MAVLALVILRNDFCSHPPQELPLLLEDNIEYFMMAQGDTSQVVSPFSRRALYPFMARCLCAASGLSLQSTFILLDIFSVILLAYLLARILILFDLSPWIVAILILTPFSADRIANGYMPDLFHAALTVLFFLLLLREKLIAALVVLAIAYMTRENTLILCLVLGSIAWLRKLYGVAVGSGGVLLFGTAFGAWAVRLGQPNIHHLPDFLYFGLKMPHQFLKNVLGLRIWTNTLPFGEPFKKFVLPSYLSAGDVHVIGLCYPEWILPLFTLITLLTLFGTGPLIVWLTRRLKLWTSIHPLAVQVAFVYGLIAFFLGTSIGDWVDRLVGYGWPLFWIGVPYILAVMKQHGKLAFFKWSLLSLWAVPWIPLMFGYDRGSSLFITILTLLAALLAYGVTWRALWNHDVAFDPRHPVIR